MKNIAIFAVKFSNFFETKQCPKLTFLGVSHPGWHLWENISPDRKVSVLILAALIIDHTQEMNAYAYH